jgi:hypothetical protein
MIRKYQKFLEELKITKELTTQEAFMNFIDELKECQRYYAYGADFELGQFQNSYSYSAKDKRPSGRPRENSDPEEDFKLVDNYMSKQGWTLETVQALAEEYGKDGFNVRIENINPSTCGPIDYYLYIVTEKTFPLQGYEWNFDKNASLSGDILENEYLIRFGYGWHNTKYGKLCIEQNLGSVSEFFKRVLRQIPFYILNKFVNDKKYKLFKPITGDEYRDFIQKFIDTFLFMDDNFYGHLDEIYEICQPYFKEKISDDKLYDLILTAIEDFQKESASKINVTRRGDEFRISI